MCLISLFCFSRELGTPDEEATLEERVEKLLYFYVNPSNPRLVKEYASHEARLKLVSLCEALLDFCHGTFYEEDSDDGE